MLSRSQPFFGSSRNAGNRSGRALRDDANGCLCLCNFLTCFCLVQVSSGEAICLILLPLLFLLLWLAALVFLVYDNHLRR